MNDSSVGNFLLGLAAAVVIFLLWKKERGSAGGGAIVGPQPVAGGASAGGCGGSCGGSCLTGPGGCLAGPTGGAAPALQSAMASLGLSGQVSPGTPPLGGDAGSFYTSSGVTSDASFTPASAANPSPNVAGSPTTPANVIPIRATQPVPPASVSGFQNRYTRSGVYTRTPALA